MNLSSLLAVEVLPANAPMIFSVIAATFVGFGFAFKWLNSQIENAKTELKEDITQLETRVKTLEGNRDEARNHIINALTMVLTLKGVEPAIIEQIKLALQSALEKLK